VIFVTVGSSDKPFPRLLEALRVLPLDELVIQHGPSEPPPGARLAVPFMSFNEIVEYMSRAEFVISHAGAGSILCALRAGHTPIVMPRLGRFGETVDDHQVDFARALAEVGKVVVAWETPELAAAIAAASPRRVVRVQSELPLHAAVRAALAGRPT
jgi:UDP-N-acetylglucosamine transferase subunit ALG13